MAEYLRNNGWRAFICLSEADTAIAFECQPNDIVISGDSDMLIYDTVVTIWRPLIARNEMVQGSMIRKGSKDVFIEDTKGGYLWWRMWLVHTIATPSFA